MNILQSDFSPGPTALSLSLNNLIPGPTGFGPGPTDFGPGPTGFSPGPTDFSPGLTYFSSIKLIAVQVRHCPTLAPLRA